MIEFWIKRLQFLLDFRIWRVGYEFHKLLRNDKNYKPLNFLRAIWYLIRHEKIQKHKKRYYFNSFFPPAPSASLLQMVKAVPDPNNIFAHSVNAERNAPISMYVAVTGQCAYNCSHCSSVHQKKQKGLSTAELKSVVAQMLDMGVSIIGFTGGEPLLRADIFDIIKEVDDRAESLVFTSGHGLDKDTAKKLAEAGLNAVGISLDHYDEAAFDNMRGTKGAFRNSLTAIEHAVEAGLYTMAQVVAQPGNIDHIYDVLKFVAGTKVHEVRVLEPIPAGKLISSESHAFLTKEERKQLIDLQKKANRTKGLPKVTVFAHTESPEMFGCGAGTQHSYIDCVGNLRPCDFVPLSFGNVTEKPVAELWRTMNQKVGKPCSTCMAFELRHQLSKKTEELPFDEKESTEIIESRKPIEVLPEYYRRLVK